MTVLQPFVWISAVTPNDRSTRKVIPLTSDVLISFTDESVFDLGAADGSVRTRTGRVKVRFVVFDKDFTYWETLFVINKRRLDIEYGWMNPDGTVATSSGKFPITLTQIGPKFSHQGTEIEVLGVSDLTSVVEPGSQELFYASRTFSILFVPESAGSPYPSPLLSNPTLQQQQDDQRLRLREEAINSPVRWELVNGVNLPVYDTQGKSQIDDLNLRSSKVSDPSVLLDPTKKVYTYSSISQLVKDLASQLGVKSDVDDTGPARNEILCTGISIANIFSRLAQEAISPTGEADYRFWIRGDTVYFKRPSVGKGKQKKVLEFKAQGSSVAASTAASSESNTGIVLAVDMKVNPSLLLSSARAGTVVATVDSSNKVVRGGNVVPPWRSIQETLGKSIVRKLGTRKLFNGTDVSVYDSQFIPPEGMSVSTATKAEEPFFARDWLLWDIAVELADPIVNKAKVEEEGLQIKSGTDFNLIRDQARIAAFELLKKQNAERLGNTRDASAEVDVNQSLYNDALKNPNSPIIDETMSGRLYPTAYQNEQASNLSKLIMEDVANKTIQAEVLCVGDVFLRLQEEVTLILSTPSGQHYTSGNYLILGISNAIDRQGFTTKLTLVSNGAVRGSLATEGSTIKNTQSKPSAASTKPQVWTDIKEKDVTTIDIENFNDDFDRRINRG